MFVGFALSLAGCPYLFTTRDLGTITSTSPLWFGGDCTPANGYLVTPTNTWTERAKPLDGDLEVDMQPFTLHDAKLSVGGVRRDLLTWLATRDDTAVASTPLASTMSDSASTFDVGDATRLTVPGVAWIEREAILCASVAGNTVTVASGGRGYFGTKAARHVVDADQSLFPEAFADLPWVARRKVVLWGVKTDGAAIPLWVGFANRAPRLSRDGARYDLPCDPFWTVVRQCPVGDAISSARIIGYGRTGISSSSTSSPALLRSIVGVAGYTGFVTVATNGAWRDWNALVAQHTLQVSDATSTRTGTRINLSMLRSGSGGAQVDGDASVSFSLSVTLLALAGERQNAVQRVISPARYAVTTTLERVPSVGYVVVNYLSTTLLVSSLTGLPSSWAASTWALVDGDPYTTTRTPALRVPISRGLVDAGAAASGEWVALFTGITTADGGAGGPRITGAVEVLPRKLTTAPPPAVFFLEDPGPLQYTTKVDTEHWAYGIRRGVVDLCADAMAEVDFDWSTLAGIGRLTAGHQTARTWYFDGQRTLGSVVLESCQLFGCTPVIRGGRVALWAWGWPDAHTPPSVSITRGDILGLPTWTVWDEGLANRLQVKSDALTINAVQAQSLARYGPGRQVTSTLAGVDQQRSPVTDPVEFSRVILARLELWSVPLGVARFVLKMSHFENMQQGDTFLASEWMLPTGRGTRGLSSAIGVVLNRTPDLGAATLAIEALLFSRLSYPYAPCAKVSSVITSTTVALAANYVGGSQTYSGGADVTTFAVGDRVQLVARDSTTLTTENLTIASINSGAARITFANSMSSAIQTAIGAGWVDLRFAPWSTPVQTSQESWMYVASESARVIDGTTEPARPIAP
jgi:hypothetical protein